jgi:hypothetical protein
MSARERLPDRRFHVSIAFEHEGKKYYGGAGYFRDGRLAELWLRADKADSHLDAIGCDGAILASMLLQHGVAPEAIDASLGKGRGGGALGRLLALLAIEAHARFLKGCERETAAAV